jgi:putative membrane protein
MTVSNAPYNSDDLDPVIFQEIMEVAGTAGLRVSLIDAHNCIGGEDGPGLKATRKEWLGVFEKLKQMPPHRLKLGYSHSSEIDFPPATDDISEGGIGVLIFENGGLKNVLIVADSNNVVAGLRERIAEDLSEKGFQLMELCTSDTHNLAAKSLEGRGYFALGEATSKETIIDAISKLLILADNRIGPCDFVIASFPMNLPLIGKESLGDFAVVTNQAFAFSKTFAKIAIPLMFVLIVAAILY